MSKVNLNKIQNVQDLTTLNENFDILAENLNDKVLYRDNPVGEPNEMSNDIDMNSNTLYNLKDAVNPHEAVPLHQIEDLVRGGGIGEAPIDGTPYDRQDGAWVSALAEAPIDGTPYTRQDGGWTSVPEDDVIHYYESTRELLNTDLSSVAFVEGERIEVSGKANEGDGGGAVYVVAPLEPIDYTGVVPLTDSFVGKLVNGPVRKRGNNAPEVIAHRGFTDANVEQTMAAFTAALGLGADSLECDVQITSDGEMVLFHDLDTTVLLDGITGEIKDNTFAQTQQATWIEYDPTNVLKDKVHLTKFTELLDYVQRVGCVLHAEIKFYRERADIGLIVDAIVERGLESLVVLHSFYLSDIQYVREINKDIRVSFLSNTLDGVDFDRIPVTVGFDWVKRDKNAIVALRIEAIDDPLNIPNPIMKEFHDADVEVAMWTLHNAKDVAIARRNNANAIICDLPLYRKQPLVRTHGTSI